MRANSITKEFFLRLLADSIPDDSPVKASLLDTANRLVIDDELQSYLGDLRRAPFRRALNLYRKFHPEIGNSPVSLEDLLDWLMSRGGIRHAMELEKRLDRISGRLAELGELDPLQDVCVPAGFIAELRVAAYSPFATEPIDEE